MKGRSCCRATLETYSMRVQERAHLVPQDNLQRLNRATVWFSHLEYFASSQRELHLAFSYYICPCDRTHVRIVSFHAFQAWVTRILDQESHMSFRMTLSRGVKRVEASVISIVVSQPCFIESTYSSV